MSYLLPIYDALAALPVTVTNRDGQCETAGVWKLGEAKNVADEMFLPVRIQFPVGVSGGNFNFSNLRKTAGFKQMDTNWSVTELFLYRGKAQGLGLGAPWRNVTEFVSNYHEAVTKRTRLLHDVEITGMSVSAVDEWPSGSGRYFYGAQITVSGTVTICAKRCVSCKCLVEECNCPQKPPYMTQPKD